MSHYTDIVDMYIQKDDLSRHNSNLIYSLPALNATLYGEVSKEYWLTKVYPEFGKKYYDEGWLYIHNLGVLGPYCSGYSAEDIAMKGLNSNAENGLKTAAPKHVHSLLGQCSNFIALISQEIHGACAINDITTVVSAYLFIEREIFKRNVDYQDLLNAWQHFIYEINVPFRAGNSSFSNITMAFGGPDAALKDEFVVYGGDHLIKNTTISSSGKEITLDRDYIYSDIPLKFYDEVNRAFIETFAKGDYNGKPFSFPLITINITDDFDFENETFELLLQEFDKWGGVYFENYRTKPFKEDSKYKELNKHIKERNAEMQRSFCCRFQVSLEDILKINSSVFRSGSGVGGIGVFNINLNRIGYVSQGDWDLYFELLDDLLEKAQELAQAKRRFLEENTELYPYFFYYNESLDSYFNVLSVCGGNESLVNMGYPEGIVGKDGIEAASKVGNFISDKINYFIKRDKKPVNLEFAPAESGSPKMAKLDLKFQQWLENDMKPDDMFTVYKNIIEDQYNTGVFFEENE
jgi:ribonucleoside-triphosphate reductase